MNGYLISKKDYQDLNVKKFDFNEYLEIKTE